ncbi:DUF2797 domain-containing protein [bacterium]|jgi:hypothetical protein|nr:DUF2797 domain-containing protein [bacterium]
MSSIKIILEKMNTTLIDGLANYSLPIHSTNLKEINQTTSDSEKEKIVSINSLIGKNIEISFTNNIFCCDCGKKTKKSFGQGFCYPCFIKSPFNAECIIRPELCKAHLREGRDVDWEIKNHIQPHIVYLAWSSHYKVGVTRQTQVPTRWIDQGAYLAAPVAECPNRYLAGCVEVALKEHFSDKTSWQKMLKFEPDMFLNTQSFLEKHNEVIEKLPSELSKYSVKDTPPVLSISYPVHHQLTKVKSQRLDKVPVISGKLMGIKGQYLIFDSDNVFNVRSHTGYEVNLNA